MKAAYRKEGKRVKLAFQEKTGKSVVITGGAPKEGDESATPEVRQIEGTSITESKVNGRSCTIYIQPTLG
jgi:hypothetical protein